MRVDTDQPMKGEQSENRSQQTGILLGAVLILAGTTAPLFLAELGMRIYHAYVKIQSPYQPHNNSQIVFVRKPNFSQEINSLGFRDREHEIKKPQGLFRIIVLGDSVTNGFKVEFDNRFTNRLEALLNLQDRKYEVINFGTNQYSTVQEVSIFEAIGREMKPDLVIVAYVLNDPTPDGSSNDFFRRDRSKSLLFHWIKTNLSRLFPDPEKFTPLQKCSFFDYYSQMHCDATKWGNVTESLIRLSGLSRADNFRVLLTVFPLLENERDATFDKYPWRDIHGRVTNLAEILGFQSLDMLPAFASFRPIDIKVSGTDQLHPNALGNEIASNALFEKLITMGLVKNSNESN